MFELMYASSGGASMPPVEQYWLQWESIIQIMHSYAQEFFHHQHWHQGNFKKISYV